MDDFDQWLIDTFGPSSDYTGTYPSGTGSTGGLDSSAGDTGNPVGSGSSFNVGPGQNPSDVYAKLISGGGGANVGAQLLKALGLGSSGSNPNLMGLLSLLAPLLTGITTSNASRQASNQLSDAAKAANAQIGGYITDAQSRYAPYITGGQNAFNAAAAMPAIAPQFKPLGSGAALSALYNAGRR